MNATETQEFEREFFAFRSVTRVSFFVCAVLFGDVYPTSFSGLKAILFHRSQDLEYNLADVMRQSFKQCWDTRAKLRLLEVFEGISGRELVQVRIKEKENEVYL